MYYKLPEMIEFITRYTTLYPGDLILTGTPTGMGPVKINDQLLANIEQDSKVIMEMKFNVEEDL